MSGQSFGRQAMDLENVIDPAPGFAVLGIQFLQAAGCFIFMNDSDPSHASISEVASAMLGNCARIASYRATRPLLRQRALDSHHFNKESRIFEILPSSTSPEEL